MTTHVEPIPSSRSLPTGSLPPQLSALYIAGSQRNVTWLADAFGTDSACVVTLESATGMADGVTRLREDNFDVVLVSHEPPHIDGLELVDAIRGGSGEAQAVVVLGSCGEQSMEALCYEAGADAYVVVETTTTRGLLWTIARALNYRRVIADNDRLTGAEFQRRDREHEEAHRILMQQRQLVETDDASGTLDRDRIGHLPARLVNHYRELLRAYVIMGSGDLDDEIRSFVSVYFAAGFCARDAMLLHVRVLEEMIRGLGNRSGRHVMNRANLLVMKVTVLLSDSYRQQYRDYLNPPRQQLLPGCEELI